MTRTELEALPTEDLAALLIHVEASNQPAPAMLGVIHAALNRVKVTPGKFGRGLQGVLLQMGCFTDDRLPSLSLDNVSPAARAVAALALSGHTLSPVGRATHYYSQRAGWPRMVFVSTVGSLHFYRAEGI